MQYIQLVACMECEAILPPPDQIVKNVWSSVRRGPRARDWHACYWVIGLFVEREKRTAIAAIVVRENPGSIQCRVGDNRTVRGHRRIRTIPRCRKLSRLSPSRRVHSHAGWEIKKSVVILH